ncbi:OadG family protein [Lachnospiraceae bacterium ZAX-1]
MMKKVFLLLCLCLCIVGMTACGTDPKDVDYNGLSYTQLKEICESTATTLEQMDAATAEQYLSSGDEMTISLIESWVEIRPQIGSYVEQGDFTITKSGKTLTAQLELKYEKRPIVLACIFKSYNMSMEDVTVDMVYSTGEKMQKAGLNTVMGIGTVFMMLIVISLIISAFRVIPYLENKVKSKLPQTDALSKAVGNIPDGAEEQYVGSMRDTLELTAVIAAAIAASTGQSTDSFVVRSIKRR